jgi:ketosteroid isomerase-like protein
MTRKQAVEYADRWADAWNRKDLDEILDHFEEEVAFSSPKAVTAVGTPTVRGKKALRGYWEIALGKITSIRFVVARVLWDESSRELAIVYDREVDGYRDRAAEVLQFGELGRVVRGEVLYGVQP